MPSRQVLRAAARQAAKRQDHMQRLDARVAKRFYPKAFALMALPDTPSRKRKLSALAAKETRFRERNAYPEAVSLYA